MVPNTKDRVLSDNSRDPTLLENGLYVCGWLKREPTGIIGTNLYRAEETVSSHLLPKQIFEFVLRTKASFVSSNG